MDELAAGAVAAQARGALRIECAERLRGAGEAPRTVVSSSRRPRPADASAEATPEADEATPLVREADPEFERLLAEEEAIEASTKEHSETPHFRPGDAD